VALNREATPLQMSAGGSNGRQDMIARHFTSALALSAVLVAVEGAARGDEDVAPSDTPKSSDANGDGERPPKGTWYGGTTLGVDFVAIFAGVLFLSVAVDKADAPLLAVTPYAVGTPSVHFLHGHPVRALASAVMRTVIVGVPLYLSYNAKGADAAGWGGFYALFGTVISTHVDAMLAYDEAPAAEPSVALAPRLRLEPEVLSVPRGAGLGLGGSF
jgi:hypothetical protein